MKLCFTAVAYWIFVTGIVTHVGKNYAQESTADLGFLCNEQNPRNCAWLENYYSQNIVDDLLQKLSEQENANFIQFKQNRNHISPRFASYATNDELQFPSTGWKKQLDRPINNWNTGKMQSKIPLNYDYKRSMDAFSSWGGKRAPEPDDSQTNKREPAFSSWGGKRNQKFFNWGGKRGISNNDNELNDALIDEQSTMKRNTATAENLISESREKRDLDNRLSATDEINLQELFKGFIEWSRKQPEQKKNSFYRKMFGVSTLHGPEKLTRRAGAFYPWGGKRNLKQN